jgi:hypothetical protein
MLTAQKCLFNLFLPRKTILIMMDPIYKDRIAALKADQKRISEEIKKARSEAKKQKIDVVAIAQTLTSVTQSVLDAKTAYEAKGLFVEIEKDEKTGLITKWKLKNRRPKNQMVDGVLTSTSKIPQFKVDDLKSIMSKLDDVFSAKDIQDVLKNSGMGERKLQPAFGNILKGLYGNQGVEKVPGMDKGPGVRYRKVK